ncbi:MAG TPA: hypothetical protein VEH27_00510 [Methylomirabilota bacterium]|nr:hypothetical protein [Methylomirabilota bacterium]
MRLGFICTALIAARSYGANKAVIVSNAPPSSNVLESDIRPIKEAIPLPDYMLWAIIAGGVLAGVIIAWFAWRLWQKRPRKNPGELLIPAHRRALELLRGALAHIDEPERFCTEVSNIARRYLEERFALHAPERTTEEFLEELRASSALSLSHKQALADFLEQCDLAKFARHSPARGELEALHRTAVTLVEETAQPSSLGEPHSAEPHSK